jgi:hypothetical protein
MAGGLALPLSAEVRHDNGGLFGRGRSGVGASGLLNQRFGVSGSTLFNQDFGGTQGDLDNEDFGSIQGGITNQDFGAPIGDGLLVLVAAGAGYATLKRNKKQNKQQQNRQ